MFGNKRKKNFFADNSVAGKTTHIEEPMLTKKEQETFQTKKTNTLSLYETENISAFKPDVPFVQYHTIRNLKIPLFLSDVHLIRTNDGIGNTEGGVSKKENTTDEKTGENEKGVSKKEITAEENTSGKDKKGVKKGATTGERVTVEERKVRCDHCGIVHGEEQSLISPSMMYQKDGHTYFEGTGYFHCFECLYRTILDQIPFYNHTYPILNERKKYLVQCMFALMYPDEKLIPAPRFENMHHDWNGKYTMIRLPGCIHTRNINFYQLKEVPV